jgi:hypothetical protein
MPSITIFFVDSIWIEPLVSLMDDLADEAAKHLSTADVFLDADHISVRLVEVTRGRMMSPVELEISAHAFPSRVARQDEICAYLRNWLADRSVPARVWLQLSDLGYGYAQKTT